LTFGHRFGHVERGTDPAHCNSVGDPGRKAFHLVNLGLGESADDVGRVRDVLPRPVAHAMVVSARRRIWLISPVVDDHHSPGKCKAPLAHWNDRAGSASSNRAVTQDARASRRAVPRPP